MKKSICIVILFFVVFCAGVIFAEDVQTNESTVKVSSSAICTSVSERMPEGINNEFSADVEKVYYWTKIDNAQGQKIKHVWKKGDTVLSEVELSINSPSYRTWSSKTIYSDIKGQITISVIDESGKVIKEEGFTIK